MSCQSNGISEIVEDTESGQLAASYVIEMLISWDFQILLHYVCMTHFKA